MRITGNLVVFTIGLVTAGPVPNGAFIAVNALVAVARDDSRRPRS